jgi:diguanylate cyclase (GGDEF)-like protein
VRKGLAIYGASEEAIGLVPILEDNPEVEVLGVYSADRVAAEEQARRMRVSVPVTDDPTLFSRPLHAVIDAGVSEPFYEAFPDTISADVQVVSPLTARLLWAYGASGSDRKGELLQALHEIVESVNLTIDPSELFERMLEIAMGVTGADGGSLMLLDAERGELRVRVAVGLEPELWPKIRVKLGEGVAGRAAAEARPLRVRGRASSELFRLQRPRADVEAALCVPLVHEGRVLGVLNLSHSTRDDMFAESDLEFAEQLGRLDAAIVARAQEHEVLRREASRYKAVQAVRESLSGETPLETRLESLCQRVAELLGGGIATVYLFSQPEAELRLAATSLAGGGLGGEYRIRLGQGLDGRAAERREPLLLESEPGQLDVAALPLLARDALVGVLSVQAGPGARDGSRVLRERLLEIAAAAADTIERARREARMSARATKIGAINETGIKLVSSRDLAEVSRLATSSAVFILEADHAILRLQDPETRRFVIRSYYGSADGRTQEKLFLLDKQLAIEALRGQRTRVISDLPAESSIAELAGGFRSALVAPLRREGRVVGTLALYDKVSPDRFFAGAFDEDDLHIFARFVTYVERGLENAAFHARADRQESFDEETGLPNADYLARRVDQEIARAGDRENELVLVTCKLDNLHELRSGADKRSSDLFVTRTAETLRTHLRGFDVLTRTGEDEFVALLPDPGPAPEERVTALARAVAEEITKDDALAGAGRPSLAFGYAVHPGDGSDREALLARARKPRIRMV